MSTKEQSSVSTQKRILFLCIVILLGLWMAYSYYHGGLFYFLLHGDTQETVVYIQSFGALSQLVFLTIVILEVVLAPIPPLLLYVIGGALFGSLYGGILALIGNLLGAYINFSVARILLKRGVEKHVDERIHKIFDKYFSKYGTFSIFILRVNPFTSSDLVSYLAGLTNVKTVQFLTATTIGLAPLIFFQTFLGDTAIEHNPLLVGLTTFFSLVYVILFAYLIIIALIKKHRNKK